LQSYPAELAVLESLQHQYDAEDMEDRDELSVRFLRDVRFSVRNTEEGWERSKKRMELAIKIWDKLERYQQSSRSGFMKNGL
jgi:hypothetical protein